MPLWTRALAVVSAFFLCFAIAHASALEPLSQDDARAYRAAFAATDRGDFDAAEAAFAKVRDRSLSGRLAFAKLLHARLSDTAAPAGAGTCTQAQASKLALRHALE